MSPVSRFLILTGLLLIAAGLIWQFGGRFLHLGRLPGDIAIEKKHFRFYFPVATSLLLSLLVSLLLYFFGRFWR